jgi:hypothetical protein
LEIELLNKLVMIMKNWPNDPKIGYLLVIRAMEDFLITKDIMFDDWTSPSLGGTTKNVTPQIS